MKSYELLKSLESEEDYLFHGSENPDLKTLEPRQAYTVVNGIKENDDRPAVHASPFSDIAVIMSLMNEKNCPDGFDSGFSSNGDKLELWTTRESLNNLRDDVKGYVYVFSKDDFTKRTTSQWIAYNSVSPIKIIEVMKSDLSKDIQIKDEI